MTDAYTGPPLLDAKWLKWNVRALWFTHKPRVVPSQLGAKTRPTRPVVCYFHGGAGVTFNAGDLHMGQNLAKTFARTAGIDIFSVDYNLRAICSCTRAAVSGCFSAYLHLVNDFGYAPEQIYIGGDSHGSWMTLQLERYLRSYKHLLFDDADNFKIPGLILLSPWIAPEDLSFKSREANVGQDIIALSYESWGVSARGCASFLSRSRMRGSRTRTRPRLNSPRCRPASSPTVAAKPCWTRGSTLPTCCARPRTCRRPLRIRGSS